jgi:arginase
MSIENKPGVGKRVSIIGVPLGFGAGKPGSELGIEAMRMSRIRDRTLFEHLEDLGYDVSDAGNVPIAKPLKAALPDDNPKYLPEMIAASHNSAAAVRSVLEAGAMPIILGGDHSIAIGTESGVASHFHAKGEDIGLIWFDAHADINTPATSSSGNIHGMPLAALLGHGEDSLTGIGGFTPKIKPQYLAHVGARDVDPGERRTVHELGLRDQFFTMSDVDRRGMQACVEDAIAIASKAAGGYAVTFDVDMIDPRFAPGSGTLVRGGTTYREAHLALETIAADGRMVSFEIVEVNPMIDQSNITVELAIELILSALGKTIL